MIGGRRRPLALAGLVVAAFAAAVALAVPAYAESIASLTINVTVNADTSMNFEETIVYDFGAEDRHGIYRDLPVYDVLDNGMYRYYDVTIDSITQDGQPATYELLDQGSDLRAKIGDADTLITGQHTYVIDYTVRNGLRTITAQDVTDLGMPAAVSEGDVEMYWDVVGDAWEVPITYARATISGPAPVLAAACYQGAYGSTATCPVDVTGDRATVGGISLQSAEGMTASVVFPGSAFTVVPFEDVAEQKTSVGVLAFLGAIPVAGLLTIVPIFAAIVMRRRDKGVDLNAAPPQYEPPEGLSPAEMMATWRGRRRRATPASSRRRSWIWPRVAGSPCRPGTSSS